ncbi:MAG: hypothetical protein ACK5NB_01505 [Flavobacteriaceae bacterium]
MRGICFVLASLCFISLSCDDGDIIDYELDFDDTFTACQNNYLVFYKTKEDPSESLSVVASGLSLDDILTVDETTNKATNTFSLSTTNVFNYITYSNSSLPSDLFCSDIPSSEITITNNYESTSGTVTIETLRMQDDNDGIPAELEDLNGNGDLTDDDTDDDDIPNYLDSDDDGDNVLTINENPDPNGDGDLSDAQDTNEDGIPDYLDNDDDGDGVLTINEENETQDQNPYNDVSDSTANIRDYLNPSVAETVEATAYRANIIENTFVVTLTISSFDIDIISFDNYSFGALDDDIIDDDYKTTEETPEFP